MIQLTSEGHRVPGGAVPTVDNPDVLTYWMAPGWCGPGHCQDVIHIAYSRTDRTLEVAPRHGDTFRVTHRMEVPDDDGELAHTVVMELSIEVKREYPPGNLAEPPDLPHRP